MNQRPGFTLVSLVLPGPDRKRQPVPYHYRLVFRAADPTSPGCTATWEVYGGREDYQIFLERTFGGELLWHCTCADAVYRAEGNNPHYCKHIRALRELFELVAPPPVRPAESQVEVVVESLPAAA